jgi:hypothetical protein
METRQDEKGNKNSLVVNHIPPGNLQFCPEQTRTCFAVTANYHLIGLEQGQRILGEAARSDELQAAGARACIEKRREQAEQEFCLAVREQPESRPLAALLSGTFCFVECQAQLAKAVFPDIDVMSLEHQDAVNHETVHEI